VEPRDYANGVRLGRSHAKEQAERMRNGHLHATMIRHRLQWGDEAKGKLVDLLTERGKVDIVVRYLPRPRAGSWASKLS